MIVSYQWLKEFLPLAISAEKLAEVLTMGGLEVEQVTAQGDDTLLEIGITPNRGDCLSLYGVARDLSVCLQEKLYPEAESSVTPIVMQADLAAPSVTIIDAWACPRYVSRRIAKVKIAPSPAWLADRLTHAGIRPLNNIVDATNYTMLAYGQPLHAFDFGKIAGKQLTIRSARTQEAFTALDGKALELTESMLVVADQEKAIALAGVIGGANSQVDQQTTALLLEAACFDSGSVRKTAKQLGLQTESSFRFEREIDCAAVARQMERLTALICQLCPEAEVGTLADSYVQPVSAVTFPFSWQMINRVLGTDLPFQQMKTILTGLGIGVTQQVGVAGGCQAEIPSWRPDLTRPADLVEEVARIYGYDNIPSQPPKGVQGKPAFQKVQAVQEKAKAVLVQSGYQETINFSFTKASDYYKLFIGQDNPESDWQAYLRTFSRGKDIALLELLNPLNSDLAVVRPDLVSSLLVNGQENLRHNNKDLALFESAACYVRSGEAIEEFKFLAGLTTGKLAPDHWSKTGGGADFFTTKGVLETVLEQLGVSAVSFEPSHFAFFHVNRQAEVFVEKKFVGFLGELRENLLEGTREPAYLFQIELSRLVAACFPLVCYQAVSRYPAIKRDLAILVDQGISFAALRSFLFDQQVALLQRVDLFDLFEGKQIGAGKKSVGFTLCYQSYEETLTDDQVDQVHQQLLVALAERFGATLRPA